MRLVVDTATRTVNIPATELQFDEERNLFFAKDGERIVAAFEADSVAAIYLSGGSGA